MVEDFLEQLSAAIPSTGAEDGLSKKMKTFKKLELRLTDRKKLSSDGYDCMICFYSSISATSWPQGFRYPLTVLPEGDGCKHYTLW